VGRIEVVGILAASVGIAAAAVAHATTAPATLYQVPVVVSEKGITIEDRLTHRGTTDFPRGAIINFVIRNRSGQFQIVRLKLLSSHVFTKYEQDITVISAGKAIPPGGVRQFAINFYYRGLFALQVMNTASHPRASAQVVIR
jgi:hypothetical protein